MEKTRITNKSDKNIPFPTQTKFKPLKIHSNQLQSKYDIYKNGSPNIYEQEIETLKMHHIKNDLSVLQLPAIDYILQQIKNTPKQIGANKRDFSIHPSMAQKYSNKFKQYSSDRQQVRDFLQWFQKKDQEITKKDTTPNKKFQLFQSLLASAFNQIINQICIISRPRAQVLKMLWNRQITEAQTIISIIHKSGNDLEKKNLEMIKTLHIDYQEQIINLKGQNYCIQKKLQELGLFNQGCVNTLRVMRKQAKKSNIIIKQLQQANQALKLQSLNLMQENTKLLMKDKNLTPQFARILSYRIMQGQSYRKKLKEKPKIKEIIKEIKNKAQQSVQNYELPDIEDRKQKLLSYILTRARQNPQQKLYIMKGQFEDEQDEIITLNNRLEEYLCTKEVQDQLRPKYQIKNQNYFKEKGINTQICKSDKSIQQNKDQVQNFDKQTQTDDIKVENEPINMMRVSEIQQERDLKKIQQSLIRKRNSLILAEMKGSIDFKNHDSVSKIRKYSRFNQNQSTDTPQKHQQPNNHHRYSLKQVQNIRFSNIFKQGTYSEGLETPLINNIKKNHKNSLLIRKSSNFQQIIRQLITYDQKQNKVKIGNKLQPVDSLQKDQNNRNYLQRHTAPPQTNNLNERKDMVGEFRNLIIKFMNKNQNLNRGPHKNPQKHLKKILTNVFKSIYVSNKYNLLGQLINVAKNCYGKLAYEDRLLQLVCILLQTKQENSLLSAFALLLRIKGFELNYQQINTQEICEFYFRIYFNLSLKNPNQNKFNLWNNYTNLNRINSSSFTNLLREYLSQSKCAYLHIKIKQFIGIPISTQLAEQTKIDGNYYVQINSLMMYLLQVYLIQKKNYYESYHNIINFLSIKEQMTLQSFVFLMDLLCFSQEKQKQLIMEAFKVKNKNFSGKDDFLSSEMEEKHNIICDKDHFYRICVKYELPLFQFMKILKYDLFKQLPAQIFNQFNQVNSPKQWPILYDELLTRMSNKVDCSEANYLIRILHQLNNSRNGLENIPSEIFNFMYYIVVLTATSQ